MRSTGEVMGIDYNLGLAFFKQSYLQKTPAPGRHCLRVCADEDKAAVAVAAKKLTDAA